MPDDVTTQQNFMIKRKNIFSLAHSFEWYTFYNWLLRNVVLKVIEGIKIAVTLNRIFIAKVSTFTICYGCPRILNFKTNLDYGILSYTKFDLHLSTIYYLR